MDPHRALQTSGTAALPAVVTQDLQTQAGLTWETILTYCLRYGKATVLAVLRQMYQVSRTALDYDTPEYLAITVVQMQTIQRLARLDDAALAACLDDVQQHRTAAES